MSLDQSVLDLIPTEAYIENYRTIFGGEEVLMIAWPIGGRYSLAITLGTLIIHGIDYEKIKTSSKKTIISGKLEDGTEYEITEEKLRGYGGTVWLPNAILVANRRNGLGGISELVMAFGESYPMLRY